MWSIMQPPVGIARVTLENIIHTSEIEVIVQVIVHMFKMAAVTGTIGFERYWTGFCSHSPAV